MQNARRAPEDGAPVAGLSWWIWVLSTAFVVLLSVGSVMMVAVRASTGIPEIDAAKYNWKGLMVFPALVAHWALYHRARTSEEGGGGALGSAAAVFGLFVLTYWKSDLMFLAGWVPPIAGFAIWFAAIVVQLAEDPPPTELPSRDPPRVMALEHKLQSAGPVRSALRAPPQSGQEPTPAELPSQEPAPAKLPSQAPPRVTAPERKLRATGPVRSAFRHPPQSQVGWSGHFVVLGVIGLLLLALGRTFFGGWNPNDLSVILYMYLGVLFLAYAAVSSLVFAFLRDNWNQATLAYVLSVIVMGGIIAVMAA